jgi:hypothetical protein
LNQQTFFVFRPVFLKLLITYSDIRCFLIRVCGIGIVRFQWARISYGQ